MASNEVVIMTGNSHPELARLVAQGVSKELARVLVLKYSNQETSVTIGESVRDEDVFIVQSPAPGDVNDGLMELLQMVNACKTASARRITAVIPNFPYARQDKKDRSRAPITARLVANLLQVAGINHVITMDLHASQIQGFFSVPVDNLYAEPASIAWLREHYAADIKAEKVVIVSPDAGGVKICLKNSKQAINNLTPVSQGNIDSIPPWHRLRNDTQSTLPYEPTITLTILTSYQERQEASQISKMVLVGKVSGKISILIDDMCDTAGTLCKAASTVKEHGAAEVLAICTHGILSGNAIKNLNGCEGLSRLVVTNTVPLQGKQEMCPKIETINIAPTLSEAIRRTHNGESVSYLFTHAPMDRAHD